MSAFQRCLGGYAQPNPWVAAAREAANDARSFAVCVRPDAPRQTGRNDEPANYAACTEHTATRDSDVRVTVSEAPATQAANSSLWAAAARNAAEEARSVMGMSTVRRHQHARADQLAYSRSRGAMEKQATCDASVDCVMKPTVSHIDMEQIAFRRQGLDSWKWLQDARRSACGRSGCSSQPEDDVDVQTDHSAVSSPRGAWDAGDDGSIDSEASTYDSTTLQGVEIEHPTILDKTAHSSLWAAVARNAAVEAKSAAVMIRICVAQDHPTELGADSSAWLPTLASGLAHFDVGNPGNATDPGPDFAAQSQAPAILEGQTVCADSSLWAASAREAAVRADFKPFFLAASS